MTIYEMFEHRANVLFSKISDDKAYYKALRKEVAHLKWLDNLNQSVQEAKTCGSFLQ